MSPRDFEKEMFAAIDRGDWNAAIEHASHLPKSHDPFQRFPSAAPIPNEATHKILDLLTHKWGHHKENLPSFLFEYANNIPDHASPDVLNRIADLGKDDWYVTDKVTKHPNYKMDDKAASLLRASEFWKSYEKKVHPSHFATIKSMFTNKPEKIKSHRGDEGSSEEHQHLIPDLKNHARAVQDAILADEFIPKKYIKGEPYIQLYRGVNGHYGKAIRDNANYNPGTNEIDNKRFILPTAHLTSWTTDPKMARSFAWHRGSIEGQPQDQGVVIPRLIAVKDILHSGQHKTVAGQEHAHPEEKEIVVGHPDAKIRVSTKEMELQEPPKTHESDYGQASNYGDTFYPTLRKNEFIEIDLTHRALQKNIKNKIVSAATALSLLGSGQNTAPHEIDQPIRQDTPVTALKPVKQKTINPDLNVIGMIESSGNKNTQHKMMTAGPHKGTAALGKYGLMSMQILDTVKRDKKLAAKYPQLLNLDYQKDYDKIRQEHDLNPDLEHDVANSHWNRLKHKFDGDTNKMSYAWLNGITATLRATPETIASNPYVQKFNKYKKMMSLENKHLKKSEDAPNKVNDVTEFVPYGNLETNRKAIHDINEFLRNGETHDLKNVGHYTHDSFIAGLDPDNSWLLKLEDTGKPDIESAKYGIQAIKEVAFYEVASRVFGLGDYTPKAILGEVNKGGKMWPTVAIKMYPESYYSSLDFEKQEPHKLQPILDREVQNGDVHKLAAMMYILGEADAHGNNLMTNGEDIKIIDHGTSFADLSFNPAKEKNVFIPYFLRVNRFTETDSSDFKTKNAPKIKNEEVKSGLSHWLHNLDDNYMMEILNKFAIDPKASLQRLNALRKLLHFMPPDEAINYAWINGIDFNKR